MVLQNKIFLFLGVLVDLTLAKKYRGSCPIPPKSNYTPQEHRTLYLNFFQPDESPTLNLFFKLESSINRRLHFVDGHPYHWHFDTYPKLNCEAISGTIRLDKSEQFYNFTYKVEGSDCLANREFYANIHIWNVSNGTLVWMCTDSPTDSTYEEIILIFEPVELYENPGISNPIMAFLGSFSGLTVASLYQLSLEMGTMADVPCRKYPCPMKDPLYWPMCFGLLIFIVPAVCYSMRGRALICWRKITQFIK